MSEERIPDVELHPAALLDTDRVSPRQAFAGTLRKWVSPGPVVDAYLRATSEVKAIMGPVGSGKTGGWIGGIVINAMYQAAWPDGIRRHRALILRDDYRKLWGNLLPTWWSWHPQDAPYGEWSGTKDGPCDHKLYLVTKAGRVIVHAMFRAIGANANDDDIVNFFRGSEAGDIVLEEGDTFRRKVFDEAVTRLGRYPPLYVGAAQQPTLFITMNAPLVGSWAHTKITAGEWRYGLEYFRQPGAREEGAENLHNLRPGYYETIIRHSDQRTIDRVVDCKFVLPMHGMPVHGEFLDSVHCARAAFDPDPGLALVFGIDGGLSPALVSAQRAPDTQWRIPDEICSEPGTGVDRFARAINTMLSLPRYAYWNTRRHEIIVVADPSAWFGNDKKEGELPWAGKLASLTGLRIRPAKTNATKPRREAVKGPLEKPLEGGVRAFLLSPRCQTLRLGLGGMFHYAHIRVGEERTTEVPVKDKYSHPCEALEYALMENGGFEEAQGRLGQTMRQSQRRQTSAITDHAPNGEYQRETGPWPATPSRQSTAS